MDALSDSEPKPVREPAPLSPGQQAFERVLISLMPAGVTVGLGRSEDGTYYSQYAQIAWRIWQHAKKDSS